jgi:glucuronoarabinoxylan endo-1,4-beta-xylanase
MNTKRKKYAFIWTRCLAGVAILLGTTLFTQAYAQTPGATVYLDSLRQVIRGFGAANIVGWRPDMTSGQIQTAFGTGTGQLGFSILRLRIPPDSTQFSIDVPSAQAAVGMGVTLIATPWTPPAWMKTNDNIAGGSLDTNNYAAYAAHLKAFADTMAGHGAPIYAISVQNEPDANVTYESCYWNAAQFLNFMKNNALSVGAPVFMPESESFTHSYSDATLNDSAACAHTAFIGGHLYGSYPQTYPLAASKGKELWMTEWLNTDTSWTADLATGKQINDCMNVGMSAYVWWYIVRFYGPINENKNSPTKRGYVMSQFSKFVRPSNIRVLTVVPRGSVYVTAYKADVPGGTANSKFVIVAVNMGSSPVDETFTLQDIAGGTATVTPYATSKTQNCEQQNSIGVSNGAFTATLGDSSITTFVGDVVTGVDAEPIVPRTFELQQNYPNPFNPTTRIDYAIPQALNVSLKVYNLLGVEVANLYTGFRQAGNYSAVFDGSAFASGVYFYRLTAGSFVSTRKFILLK